MPPSRHRADLIVEDCGSVAIIRGMSDAGWQWVESNVSSEGYHPFGMGARLCEPPARGLTTSPRGDLIRRTLLPGEEDLAEV